MSVRAAALGSNLYLTTRSTSTASLQTTITSASSSSSSASQRFSSPERKLVLGAGPKAVASPNRTNMSRPLSLTPLLLPNHNPNNKTSTTEEESSERPTANNGATATNSDSHNNSSSQKGSSFLGENKRGGRLIATVLSCYDLPPGIGEEPTCVTLSVSSPTIDPHAAHVSTGPPSARHQHAGRHSYRFVPSSSSSSPHTERSDTRMPNANANELVVDAPRLLDLYTATAEFRVEFPSAPHWTATISLQERLRIHESSWLILHLHPSTSSSSSTSQQPHSPTLRLKLRLEGPYRPEIHFVVNLGQRYFQWVDQLQNAWNQQGSSHHGTRTDSRFQTIGTVLGLGLFCTSPLWIPLGILGLPLLLPLLVLVGMALVGLGVTLYASSEGGRNYISHVLQPAVHTFLGTPVGQRLAYPISTSTLNPMAGLVPSRHFEDQYAKLALSLGVDVIGSCSYLLPILGEVGDVVWAPLQTLCIMAMYANDEQFVSPFLKYLSFWEELLPFTDVIPSATLGWIMEYYQYAQNAHQTTHATRSAFPQMPVTPNHSLASLTNDSSSESCHHTKKQS